MRKKALLGILLAAVFVLGAALALAEPWEDMELPSGEIVWQALGQETDVYLLLSGKPASVRSQPKKNAKTIYPWRRFALRASDYLADEAWHKVALPGGEGYVPASAAAIMPAEQRPYYASCTATKDKGYVYVASKGALPLLMDLRMGDKHHKLLLSNDGAWQPVLLTLGAGDYVLSIYEAGLYDAPVRLLTETAFSVASVPQDTDLALLSSLHTNMADHPVTIALAKSLCKDAQTPLQKVNLLWDWLYAHAEYDRALSKSIQFSEIPNGDGFILGYKGICSDYAAFMAAGLRAVGVPCKQVDGRNMRTGHQHAWNEVWLDGTWQIIDVTMAQSAGQKKFHTENAKHYGAEKGTWDGFH